MASSTFKVGDRVRVHWPRGCKSTGVIRAQLLHGNYVVQPDDPQLILTRGATRVPAFPGCIEFVPEYILEKAGGLLDI